MDIPEVIPPADFIPARMLNEFAYCPRLLHLMHVEGVWKDNEFTVDGQFVHRNVDKDTPDALPDAGDESEGDAPPVIARSTTLSSEILGLIAKMDIVEVSGNVAEPVDYKRGKVPDIPERAYEPERVQLMAQGLLLREHGYTVQHGVLYYHGSRTRVTIEFTPELEQRTRELLEQARQAAGAEKLPPPLDDSPKCVGCSLAPLCLPDETNFLNEQVNDTSKFQGKDDDDTEPEPAVRRLHAPRDDAMPVYIQEYGAVVCKKGEAITVKKKKTVLMEIPRIDISELILCGSVSVTPQAIKFLLSEGVPITYMSMGHWFYGTIMPVGPKNSFDRAEQFRTADDPARSLAFAKEFVRAKATNQRTMIRRNAEQTDNAKLSDMARWLNRIDECATIQKLLGIEGAIAAAYFSEFGKMLKSDPDRSLTFEMKHRNRRPPKDPVNAMLSFGYAVLSRECTVALASAGLDPYWGFFHKPRHGRPALALDLMEEFRPLIVDSAVVSAINRKMVRPDDFIVSGNACAMKPDARKAVIRALEYRLDQLITHPMFDYKSSWRSVIRVQARLLARVLRGDIPKYIGVITR